MSALAAYHAAERRAADASYRHASGALSRAMAQSCLIRLSDGRYFAGFVRTEEPDAPDGLAARFVRPEALAMRLAPGRADGVYRWLEARGMDVRCETVTEPRRVGGEQERVPAGEHVEAVSDDDAPWSGDRDAGGWGE